MHLKNYSFLLNLNNEYDATTALSLALACELSYRTQQEIKDTALHWSFEQVEYISITKGKDIDTQCVVMANEQQIVIIFKGTHSVNDWLTNFQAVREAGPLEKTLAHEGFQDALFPAVIKITSFIDKFQNNQQKIWLTGHSLGGALCSLYAGMLCENGYQVDGLYTFASPRPGDESFARQLNQKILGPHYRVVNDGDIVPHLPPEPFFSHAGQRYLLEEEFGDHSDESWLSQRIKALKIFTYKMGRSFDIVDNHSLFGDDKSYIAKLEQRIKTNK